MKRKTIEIVLRGFLFVLYFSHFTFGLHGSHLKKFKKKSLKKFSGEHKDNYRVFISRNYGFDSCPLKIRFLKLTYLPEKGRFESKYLIYEQISAGNYQT